MRFKDLNEGKIFSYTPECARREIAIKVEQGAYILRTGERVTIHAHKHVDEVTPLKGDERFRLAVNHHNDMAIISQIDQNRVLVQEFLIIGHSIQDKRGIIPLKSKAEREELDAAIRMIIGKLEQHHLQAAHLLAVLKDHLLGSD